MGDIGSFKVESEKLRQEGGEWTNRAGRMADAKGLAEHGKSKGYKFGLLAQNAGLPAQHDTFLDDIVQAFTDGKATFDYFAAALISAANAYDGVDATSATSHDELRKLLPR